MTEVWASWLAMASYRIPVQKKEQILETYYSFPVSFWQVSLDYQLIVNPGYNRDRGPASVLAARLHTHS